MIDISRFRAAYVKIIIPVDEQRLHVRRLISLVKNIRDVPGLIG